MEADRVNEKTGFDAGSPKRESTRTTGDRSHADRSFGRPAAQGLYDPRFEHDACGVNFVVDMKGRKSHEIVALGIGALCNLDHRGASGADVATGDGAGILIQVPDRFFRAVLPFELPAAGHYAAGIAFLPQDPDAAARAQAGVERIAAEEGLRVLGWRDVPTNESILGPGSRATMPIFRQVFVAGATPETQALSGLDLDRYVYPMRKRCEHEIELASPAEAGDATAGAGSASMAGTSATHEGVYFPSLSSRTLVYKGMLTTLQLAPFFPDLSDERMESALALVHSRFSTNTFPSWPLAHPYRFVAHNGEINTVQGNRAWMRTRESLLKTDLIPGDLERVFPTCTPGGSDTMSFDETLELLHMGGYSLPHAVLMMIPQPWEKDSSIPADRHAFYQYHSGLMEPWDGPASIAFTDGTIMGAVLDRNGLRPSRYWVTDDGLVVMASEVGVVDVPARKIVEKGRLQPGKMFLVDTSKGRIIRDDEIKDELCGAHPYQAWIDEHVTNLHVLPEATPRTDELDVVQRQKVFGWTHEDLKILLAPMAGTGKEAIGSMGTDTPVAVLSDRSRLLYDYFQQLFAQVTNPPLDAIREELVTGLGAPLGPEGNLFDPRPESCRQLFFPEPVIDNEELARVVALDGGPASRGYKTTVVPALFRVAEDGSGLRQGIADLCANVSKAIDDGATIIVISDRGATPELAPIPALLATSAVHHHLVREKTRTRAGLIVETGEAREVHHHCLLIGFGAAAINPYLAFDSIDRLIDDRLYVPENLGWKKAHRNYVKAASAGILKVMSKMGISTVQSYTGAQIFEAIGLSKELIDEHFTGTMSRLGGVGLEVIGEEVAIRHRTAFPQNAAERAHRDLWFGGEYKYRREGEFHLFNPESIFKLQQASRSGSYETFKQYSKLVDDQSRRLATLRGLFRLRTDAVTPVAIDEVEPVESIVKRFATGAMSYGSISKEAHETLAIAMNRIGGKSNTGEGGEDADRFLPDENGDLRRSAIKQVASGRFGVTSEYLVNADDLQIKMAQGAKPGEGGQLPGGKVYPWIAQTRHSTPGVGLISPPPHHDIYSIEDLAQLIHDLKNANRDARIHVKLVAEMGVGTVATGVAKAHADVVLISGHDGGTGASPLTSIKHAGAPWELGLAETQQTLLLNGLRDRIVVQADGQLKTGRDVLIAALLGAEEFGFATAPLVATGCVMMRVCHLDTCPVGVATQDPELRKKFTGKPEFVVNFMMLIAQEVREHLASLGLRSIEEAVGRVDLLDTNEAIEHWKASSLDLSPILHVPENPWPDQARHQVKTQDHGLDGALDNTLIELAQPALQDGTPVSLELPIRNVNRTVGTMLGSRVTKLWGGKGLPDDTIRIAFTGSAGNSFGAFVPAGISLRLEGDANDYVGKGLSGGRIVVTPPRDATFAAEENIIAGNVILYGATSGEAFIRGVVGERFCVRNSGATAVVEGVGDHGCEYMTGGRVIVLGKTGRNFAAGMSGGIAWVYDADGDFESHVNHGMVELGPAQADERAWLRETVERHVALTGSEVGERILADWDASVERFVRVMPGDYRRVLEAQARVRADSSVNELEAIMSAAHG